MVSETPPLRMSERESVMCSFCFRAELSDVALALAWRWELELLVNARRRGSESWAERGASWAAPKEARQLKTRRGCGNVQAF